MDKEGRLAEVAEGVDNSVGGRMSVEVVAVEAVGVEAVGVENRFGNSPLLNCMMEVEAMVEVVVVVGDDIPLGGTGREERESVGRFGVGVEGEVE